MSLLTDIGMAKMRALRNLSAPPKPPASEPEPSAPREKASPRLLQRRARRALWFGAKMIAGFVWWEVILIKILGRERVDQGRMNRWVKVARDFRALAVDLGGVWIKLGQFLSSRVDMLPPQVVNELGGLQDAVPPEPADAMLPVIESELGRPINEVFDDFEPEPVAAASFGQAYLASLRMSADDRRPDDGRPSANGLSSSSIVNGQSSMQRVVVKVQRPFMQDIVSTDLRSLKTIAGWLKLYKPIRRHANVDALIKEFSDGVFAELDYEQEARNAAEFSRSFAKDPGVRVPKVLTELTTKRVIVLKNVEDIKITDYDGLQSAGVSRQEVARKLFETYLQQIFVDGFFHADPHPGNLFVQPLGVEQARLLRVPVGKGTPFRLTYVDFGMMGRVSSAYMTELKEIIIATSLKDARRLVAAAQRMGFFRPEADIARIEQAVGTLFDRFWGVAVSDISNVSFDEMYNFAEQFRDLLSSLPVQIPQDVLYLGRAVNILAGMSAALDPNFNPWQAMLPFAQGIANAQVQFKPQDVINEVVRLFRQTVQLPNQSDAFFSRALNGQLEIRAQLSPSSTNDLRRIETGVSRLTWALVFAALLICGTLLAINSVAVGAVVCLGLAVLTFVRLITL